MPSCYLDVVICIRNNVQERRKLISYLYHWRLFKFHVQCMLLIFLLSMLTLFLTVNIFHLNPSVMRKDRVMGSDYCDNSCKAFWKPLSYGDKIAGGKPKTTRLSCCHFILTLSNVVLTMIMIFFLNSMLWLMFCQCMESVFFYPFPSWTELRLPES